ncbi:serine carboxypeptidase S28-domain-containing protein [Suillus plorans]|uniref:Serine carboxypeptidase S28-domain-containing protein n=1 Tax=Suillus plorans TaxID=116603 RepID=A0A9P7AF35_9AGAM|nr:serine carboxypeptidase S28-domain-containing protein [Suillus plorans]KAG1787150.1 serine carboxypeptidase S28-domain-containing protein [Suillus plorans]
MMWALASLLLAGHVRAAIPNAMLRGMPSLPKLPVPDRFITSPNGTVLPPITTVYYFDQLIDHNNPDLGTFQQRYWMGWEFYEPGGPIILTTPGEGPGDGSEALTTNETINGLIAQQQNGAVIDIEHRFFGYSNPYDNLTSQSLALLTIQQAIDDLEYFANTADLPMPGGDAVKPGQAPWILTGGSYAGALTGWTMVNKPGLFWAAYASSGVVEAITDYYEYFTPVREYMPQNCSSDVEAVIAHLDELYIANDTAGIQTLKEAFGLGDVVHVDDFATAKQTAWLACLSVVYIAPARTVPPFLFSTFFFLTSSAAFLTRLTLLGPTVQNNLFEWQNLQPAIGPGAMFFQFCDALEVKDGVSAGPEGWGLEHAIYSWGNFWNTTYYKYICESVDAETCFGTYNTSQPYWTNVTVNNSGRSWFWMVCNQVGWYQVGPPEGQPAIVSRILQPIYNERLCVNMFPQAFAYPPQPTTTQTDTMYAGWNVNVPRLFFANGLRDPWRESTVSADGLNKPNTTSMPIYQGDGFHCSDMLAKNGIVDPTVAAVQEAGLRYMKEWLAEWRPST